MCLEVFVAADNPLPVIPLDPAAPALCMDELRPGTEIVRTQFSKPFVYDIGVDGGCACALQRTEYELAVLSDPAWTEDTKAEVRAAAEERREPAAQLYAFLAEAVREAGPIELFTCWSGDWATEPVSRQTVTLAHFHDPLFGFEEKQFFSIGPAERVLGLHEGLGWISDDFDAPLPDEFRPGEKRIITVNSRLFI